MARAPRPDASRFFESRRCPVVLRPGGYSARPKRLRAKEVPLECGWATFFVSFAGEKAISAIDKPHFQTAQNWSFLLEMHSRLIHRRFKPRPCGFHGDPKRECRCSLVQVQRYRDRISGPLLDRIDIHLEVPAVEFREIASKEQAESSSAVRERIEDVRKRQSERFARSGKIRCNARMNSKMIRAYCQLDDAGEGMLRMAMQELNLSARAYDRILKVSRTIADLAGAEQIVAEHVGEAIQYRTLDRNLWG